MTRLMGDATHDNVGSLVVARPQLVAGYVTGSPGIQWTAADWALFPGIPHVTIDQGYTGSPVPDADVRDVETGAWTVANAVNRSAWTAARPTIYCSASLLPALAQAGWRGDVWVALYDGIEAVNFPVPAGMNVVAKQYTDKGGGGAYDLSAVFDPAWPAADPPPAQEDPMPLLIRDPATGATYLLDGGRMHHIGAPADLNAYTDPAAARLKVTNVSTAEVTSLLADFPPGNPAVTVSVPPLTLPALTATTTITAT